MARTKTSTAEVAQSRHTTTRRKVSGDGNDEASSQHRRRKRAPEEKNDEEWRSPRTQYRERRDDSPERGPRGLSHDGEARRRTAGSARRSVHYHSRPSESPRERRVRHGERPAGHRSRRSPQDDTARVDVAERRRSSSSSTTAPTPTPRRSTSLRESSSRSASQTSLARSQTTTARRSRPSPQDLPVIHESSKLTRSASVFGSLFGPPRPKPPEPKVTCLTCMVDDIRISRAPKLACGHHMCNSCLKRIFTLSVTDPAHMPPKCCTSDCIPLKYVDRLFDLKFKLKWNRKYQEYTTMNRLYCPKRGCGSWIQPQDIKTDSPSNRKYGRCVRCRTKVCAKCNGKWHLSPECPNDESTLQFAEMAKKEGWQKCLNCSAIVELKEGCNHMTCRCTFEFCMICGSKWKTCDCPWFNYTAVENDRLRNMNVAQVREEYQREGGAANLNRPRAYHEEMERRREQEQRDEQLARQLQRMGLAADLGPVPRPAPRNRNRNRDNRRIVGAVNANTGPVEIIDVDAVDLNHNNDDEWGVWGIGTGAAGFANEHFVNRAMDILRSPVDTAQAQAADRLVEEIRDNHRVASLGAGLGDPPPLAGGAAANRYAVPMAMPARRRSQRATAATAATAAARNAVRVEDFLVEDPTMPSDFEIGARIRRPAAVAAAMPPPPPPPPIPPPPPNREATRDTPAGEEEEEDPTGAVEDEDEGEEEDAETAALRDRINRADRRRSALAGLNRRSRTARVDEWRRFVEDDDEPPRQVPEVANMI